MNESRVNRVPHHGQFSSGIGGDRLRVLLRNAITFCAQPYRSLSPLRPMRSALRPGRPQSPTSKTPGPELRVAPALELQARKSASRRVRADRASAASACSAQNRDAADESPGSVDAGRISRTCQAEIRFGLTAPVERTEGPISDRRGPGSRDPPVQQKEWRTEGAQRELNSSAAFAELTSRWRALPIAYSPTGNASDCGSSSTSNHSGFVAHGLGALQS